MLGTIVNIITVLIGSLIGSFFSKKLPSKVIKTIYQAIGLFTIFLGFQMASKTQHYLIMIFSLLFGAICGEFINLERITDKFGNFIKKKIKTQNPNFSEGFVSAFLLFCMGSMTILGAIEEGMGNKPNLLVTKSLLDGFSSMALASALGIGVAFSVIPLFIYQGGLTFLALWFGNYFSQLVINELTAVGGIILVGIGISILDIKKINAVNLLPALIFAIIFTYLTQQNFFNIF